MGNIPNLRQRRRVVALNHFVERRQIVVPLRQFCRFVQTFPVLILDCIDMERQQTFLNQQQVAQHAHDSAIGVAEGMDDGDVKDKPQHGIARGVGRAGARQPTPSC
jgi:hypothetical protein